MAAQRCAKGAKVRGGYPLSAPFTPFCPGLHPSAGFAPFCQVCTLLPGLHPSARFAPFCQVCTLTERFPDEPETTSPDTHAAAIFTAADQGEDTPLKRQLHVVAAVVDDAAAEDRVGHVGGV